MFPSIAAIVCVLLPLISTVWLIVSMSKAMRGRHGVPHPSQWSKVVRDDLKPIREVMEQIEWAISRGSASTAVRVLGKEALPEAQKLLQFAYRTAERRQQMISLIQAAEKQEREAARLELQLASATSVEERTSLENSIANYRKVRSKVGLMQEGLSKTSVQLREAHAAMVELHSQIVTAGTSAALPGEAEDLRETLARIRDLSRSFEEVDETLEQRLQP